MNQGLFKFKSQRRISKKGMDPEKLVVFFDNDLRNGPVIAVCMMFPDVQAVFSLVDDFGSFIKETMYPFKCE